MSSWLTSHHAPSSRRKRNGSDAFADDWGSYENDRSHGNVRGRGGQQQPQHARHVRRPAVPGVASHVPSYSPYGGGGAKLPPPMNGRVGGGGGGGFPGSFGGGRGPSGNACSSSIDASRLRPSMRNPAPTVRIDEETAGTLSPEQKDVVEAVLSGYSTFFTGPAGSGKSHVLSTVVRLNEEGRFNGGKKKRIVITATTGISACNVGGTTINSFAGVGTGDSPLNDLVARVMGNEYSKKRWRECDVLVIDEVSMMPAGFLDKLNFVATRARNDRRPFGGIQLILCGDFFQLPPVNLDKNSFAFEAKCWPEIIKCSILLKQIFRQNGDQTLMKVLNEARVGELSSESAQILRRHSAVGNLGRPEYDSGDVQPTLLESRNAQVDRANAQAMARLPGEVRKFHARDKAVNKVYEKQLQHCQAPETLELKVGAQVILLKNVDPDKGLVNGSRGIIVDFQLAKNKSDLPREFRKVELPVVRFDSIDAPGSKGDDDEEEDEGVMHVVEPAEWTNRVGDATVSSRIQVPLRLAWALSVHKSQGMTIPNLAVSLRGVFEYGQAYVALSRATKLSLLTLRGFEERAFRAHPTVKEFYRLLDGGSSGDGGNENPSRVPVAAAAAGKGGTSSTGHATTMGGAEKGADSGRASSSPRITEEQRRRMEENRLRALARKQQKQAAAAAGATKISTGTADPSGQSSSSNGSSRFFSNTTPTNPYSRIQ